MRVKARQFTYIIICAILFLVFLSLIIFAGGKLSVTTASNNVVPKNTRIVIDPGHGGEDGGAVTDDGVLEKDINLAISKDTAELFHLLGFEVVLTRSSDISLSGNESTVRQRKVADMKKRLELYNSSEENTVISIHQNKFTQSKYNGTQIFYSPNNEKSQLLAENIRMSVKSFLQPENERECKKSDNGIYLLKNTDNPAVIVECGFISNEQECKKLLEFTYQKQMAFSVAVGFLNYYNNYGCENNGFKN